MNNITVTDVREKAGDAAFLIDDGKNAILYDSGFGFTGYAIAEKIKGILGERPLDLIFLTHSHYDHALGAVYVKKLFPKALIIASEYTAKIFEKPTARAVMRELDGKFALECGVACYEDLIDDLTVDTRVKDGDIIGKGNMQFEVLSLPGHTKCSVGFYCRKEKLLLGCETLGVYDGKGDIVPSFLVGYDMTLESIKRVLELDIESIVVPHYGLLAGNEAKLYLERSYSTTKSTTEDFVKLLRIGKSNADILEEFKKRFYHGAIRDAYPVCAMELNVGIMTDLLRKEFGI